MSYHIYQTEGFILSSISVNEASRYLSIYTKDLGLIRALAQGSRNLRSKLKHSLQDLSFSKVSFVRGREIWRIVNSECIYFPNMNLERSKKDLLAKTSLLLRRLINGEEADPRNFEDIMKGFYFMINEDLTSEELSLFEPIFILKILRNLGYGPFEKELQNVVDFEEWERSRLFQDKNVLAMMFSHIDKALKHSHL